MPLPLAPIAAACVFGILIAYGMIAPAENELRSHRVLARELHRIVPAQVHTLNFFNEIDEGLWFYLSGIDLAPVPGTHPRYNTAYDLAHSFLTKRQPSRDDRSSRSQAPGARQAGSLRLGRSQRAEHLLFADPRQSLRRIRRAIWPDRAVPLFRETGLKRNELVLLQVANRRPLATPPPPCCRRRRSDAAKQPSRPDRSTSAHRRDSAPYFAAAPDISTA